MFARYHSFWRGSFPHLLFNRVRSNIAITLSWISIELACSRVQMSLSTAAAHVQGLLSISCVSSFHEKASIQVLSGFVNVFYFNGKERKK